jgi:hypothetical protein
MAKFALSGLIYGAVEAAPLQKNSAPSKNCGREADFSTALLAKARAASVEMTVPE